MRIMLHVLVLSMIIPGTHILGGLSSGNENGNKALFEAVREGDVQRIKTLLKRVPLPIGRDKLMKTPLHYAAALGDLQLTELLASHLRKNNKDGLDARDKNGVTPLLFALSWDQEQTALILLYAGAQPDLMSDNGLDPLSIAAHKKMPVVTSELKALLIKIVQNSST